MSERDLLRDSVDALLAAHCPPPVVADARDDGWSAAVWELLERAGIPLAAVPEQHGGAGGTLAEAATVVRLGGYHGVPAPLAETALVAGPLLAAAGIAVPAGPLSAGGLGAGHVELECSPQGGDGRLAVSGALAGVPYGRIARAVVALARQTPGDALHVVLLDPAAATLEPGGNLAGELRDTLRWEAATPLAAAAAPRGVDAAWLLRRGALARSLQLAGAVRRVAEMGLAHATEREQFGRPLARFQVIQHQLAVVAEEACAAAAAAEVAVERSGSAVEEWTVAAAKVRCGQAATRCAAAVHQVHGAVGVTREHPLHLFTMRLWSWRDECGDESLWSIRLGRLAAAAGAGELWPMLAATSA